MPKVAKLKTGNVTSAPPTTKNPEEEPNDGIEYAGKHLYYKLKKHLEAVCKSKFSASPNPS